MLGSIAQSGWKEEIRILGDSGYEVGTNKVSLQTQTTGLPSSFCVGDCALNGFIGDQISLSKGDALAF